MNRSYAETDYQDTTLTEANLYDRLLGALVGSAIGDAMGAPTEMWDRKDIRQTYGYVDALHPLLREPSPEGPWGLNLPAGATTDDTRWKALMIDFVLGESDQRTAGQPLRLKAGRFAAYLNAYYEDGTLRRMKTSIATKTVASEDDTLRVMWLKEWARVTRAYASGDINGYRDALARFYGGEMSCAGMLYAPVIGMLYPGRPEIAYENAYDLSLFDLGYSRDITAMTAALTAAAINPMATIGSLTSALCDTDPQGFCRSRLLGRLAYKQYERARDIVRAARRLTTAAAGETDLHLPANYPYGEQMYARITRAYELLDEARQDVSFHAGEIHLINLTAILISDLNFQRAMEFITNYGRDNDTVAAVTGAILGGLHGYSKLPRNQRELVVRVNRETLGMDLEELAWELTQAVVSRRQAV